MTKCLVALGSNLGDRAATLDAAIDALSAHARCRIGRPQRVAIDARRGRIAQISRSFSTGRRSGDFTRRGGIARTIAANRNPVRPRAARALGRSHARPRSVAVRRRGHRHADAHECRIRGCRFAASCWSRRSRLPATMVHPTIGWTLERFARSVGRRRRLRGHRVGGRTARSDLAATLVERFGLTDCAPAAIDERLWPAASTTWLAVPDGRVSSEHPKLTILLDLPAASEAGRGPTLRIGLDEPWRSRARGIRGDRGGLASSRPARRQTPTIVGMKAPVSSKRCRRSCLA